jgi:hypothetical protein
MNSASECFCAEGITPGFYYSLMDWHHPDGARCATDEAARRRFVDYIHGQIRELMTKYGQIGVLWGFQTADDNWKSPKTVVRNLQTVGKWMEGMRTSGPERNWPSAAFRRR